MNAEQILAEQYVASLGGIPKAPPAMTIEMLNAGAWGTLPVLMNVSRARRFELETIRPSQKEAA